MKTTIQDMIIKVRKIDETIRYLDDMSNSDDFTDEDWTIADAIDLLKEYRDMLLNTQIDI